MQKTKKKQSETFFHEEGESINYVDTGFPPFV